jgi:hypothetical protein
MKHTHLAAALALAALVTLPARADELSDLRDSVRQLSDKLARLEAQQAKAAAPAPTAATAAAPAGYIAVPGTTTAIKLGGYAQLDGALDLKGDQGRAVSLSDAPLNGSAAAQRHNTGTLSARTSRVNFETLTDTGAGPLKTRIEFDFFTTEGSETYTNSARPRLRHAYGQYGGWLAGQTWSTFMDPDSVADTLEFNGPSGQVFIRQAQLRYSMPAGGGQLDLALENPQTDARDAAGSVTAQDRLPDMVARWTLADRWGHLTLRGLLRDLRAENGAGGGQATTVGYGLGVSGSFKLGAADTALYQLNVGKGIGRYIQDVNAGAAYDPATTQLHAERAASAVLGWQHQWTETVRSNLLASFTRSRNSLGYGDVAGLNRRTAQAYANVIWRATKNLDVGLEYGWGERRTEAGDKGEVSRLQSSVKYMF